MVVYAVIRHWVTVVAETEAVKEGLGLFIRGLVSYFYADYGLVTSTQPERLQQAFDFLTGFFNWVGLSKNMQKTVSMAC